MASNSTSFVRIGHINAQSLEAHLPDVHTFIIKNNLHALAISESWLKPNRHSKLLKIPGYHLTRVDRSGKGGGGVALYLHESFSFKVVAQSNQSENYIKRPEFLFVAIRSNHCQILLGVVYSPPKCGFLSDVEEALLSCNVASDFTILLGDFNINWDVPSTPGTILRNFLFTCALEPLPFRHTHHASLSCSTIDYIFVSDTSKVSSYHQLYTPSISKHEALVAVLAFKISRHSPRACTRRSYRSFNEDSFLSDLFGIDWSYIDCLTDVSEKVNFFTASLTALYDKHAPYRTFALRKRSSPWINPVIRGLIKERNIAWSTYKRFGRQSDHINYKKLRNRVKTLTRNAIANHFRNKFSAASSPTDMWKVVDEMGLLTRPASQPSLPASVDAMNTYFTGNDAQVDLHDQRPTARLSPGDRFFFRLVTDADVIFAINSIKSNARGPDDIPMKFLRDCLPAILPVLKHIFDCSLQSGTFPEPWKRAIVRPIPKCSQPREIRDFRPISILCAPSKVLESIAFHQISAFVADNQLLDQCQSGFRKHFSTHTALIKMVDDIREVIDQGEVVLLVGIDLTRAFDMVNINLLVEKLSALGFSDCACNWVYSFLTNRSQVVAGASGEMSSPVYRLSGVPQGSLNGPPFFSLFLNDAPCVLKYCRHHVYADDITIYLSGPVSDLQRLVDRVNEDLTNLSNWATSNGLMVNPDKTQAIWFGSRGFIKQVHELNPPELIMDGRPIRYCDNLKLLGVMLDEKLTWAQQTATTSRKCHAALARLRKCNDFLPKETKLTLVKALVFPYLDYCSALFLDLSDELCGKLNRCKNAAIRFALGLRRFDHISPAYASLRIMSVTERRNFLSLCLLASVLRNKTPGYLYDELNFRPVDAKGSKRCSPLDLVIKRASTNCYQNSFVIGIPRLWNDLPLSLRSTYMNQCFKLYLEEYILNRLYVS